MKLATERTNTPDGRLLVVSTDLQLAVPGTGIAATLQDALDRWETVSGPLQTLYDQLNERKLKNAIAFQADALAAPLPRAWQWLDASAFPTHGELMQKAFDLPDIQTDRPLMYQGLSHQFLGPAEDVPLPSQEEGIDFEGEFGIITGAVPMGTRADDAIRYVRLAVQINDWSLRRLAPVEMKTGFGWIQAKPACSMAPVAVTLDELGGCWTDARITATLEVYREGEIFGAVPATQMAYGFHELIAHASHTRSLCAGTIIGSGTVSHSTFRQAGSCCIAERRAIEMIDTGVATTSFLRFGERVRMLARSPERKEPLFGVIDQRVTGCQ